MSFHPAQFHSVIHGAAAQVLLYGGTNNLHLFAVVQVDNGGCQQGIWLMLVRPELQRHGGFVFSNILSKNDMKYT